MQLEAVLPGLRPAAVNIAVAGVWWSSVSVTEPALKLLFGLVVVDEKAAYDACHTRMPLAMMPSGTVAANTFDVRDAMSEPPTRAASSLWPHLCFGSVCRRWTSEWVTISVVNRTNRV